MGIPTAVMVGADKGGVGKTFLTRCLLDYLSTLNLDTPIRIFDTETPSGVLNRFYPDAKLVDLTNNDDQMEVLDNLGQETSLIDIRAGLLSPTLKLFSEIGLLDMVKTEQVKLVVFHVLGPNMNSLQEVLETINVIKGATYILVKNHINDAKFFDWDPAIASALSMAPSLSIPQLEQAAVERIDRSSVPFTSWIKDPGNSFVLRGKAQNWLKEVYAEFNRAGVRKML